MYPLTSVANSNFPKICLSASKNLQNLHLQKCALLLHFYVTIFSKMKIMLRNIFKKFSVEKIWNFYHTKSAKTCTICIKICHFLSKEKICHLGQKSLQIFVKISSARKIENLPFSEKSAELATLFTCFCYVCFDCVKFAYEAERWLVDAQIKTNNRKV